MSGFDPQYLGKVEILASLRTQVVRTALAKAQILSAVATTLHSANVAIDAGVPAGTFLFVLDELSAVDGAARTLLLSPIPVLAGDVVEIPCGNGVAASVGVTLVLSTLTTATDGPPPTATVTQLAAAGLRLLSAEVT